MTIPDKEFKWAEDDIIDPIYNIPNKLEPDETIKSTGVGLRVQPNRQHYNYNFNLIGKWLKYFNDSIINISSLISRVENIESYLSTLEDVVLVDILNRISNLEGTTGSFDIKITTSHLTVEQVATWNYIILYDMIFIFIPEIKGISNSMQLQISPTTNFPSEIIGVSTIVRTQSLCINENIMPGFLKFPNNISDPIICYLYSPIFGYYVNNGFASSIVDKGLCKQIIKYHV
jgi:hypothetical protein